VIAALIVLALAGQAGGASSLAAFEQSLLADPENLRVAADYRQVAIGAGDFDRPIEFLEKLSKRAGAGPNVFLSLALAYVDKVPTSGDIRRLYLGRDAMNAATKSIERKPTPFAYYMRGQINLYYNNVIFKRVPRGIEDLKKALELTDARTPSVVLSRIYAALGDGYWRLDDRTRAREVWKEGAARIPGDTALARRLEGDSETVRWVVIDALSASTRVDTSLRGVVPSP
jgi:tetratricopeptide (TPR) repeat protein